MTLVAPQSAGGRRLILGVYLVPPLRTMKPVFKDFGAR